MFFAVTTAFTRLIEQYYLQESYLVLLLRSYRSSSNPVYRSYYCFCKDDGAVLVEEFVLSTAFVRLMEQ